MLVITNAFSLNVLRDRAPEKVDAYELAPYLLKMRPLTLDEARAEVRLAYNYQGYRSVVGHAQLGPIYSTLLGTPVAVSRETYAMASDEVILVGQYTGPRLEEGTKQLPAGAKIEWWLVTREN